MLGSPSAPFEPLSIGGESITIPLNEGIMVLCTGNSKLLPLFNEYTLTEGRSLSEGTYTFTNDYNPDTGIKLLSKPWITVYDPAETYADFYLFSYMPTKLDCEVDYSGKISELTLYPENGVIYWGRNDYPDLDLDSNGDLIPDFLDPNVNGSLPQFLDFYTVADGPQGLLQFITSDGKEFVTSDGKYLFVRP